MPRNTLARLLTSGRLLPKVRNSKGKGEATYLRPSSDEMWRSDGNGSRNISNRKPRYAGHTSGRRSVDHLVLDSRLSKRNDRGRMGYFMAHVDRSRYVLDAASHLDPIERGALGNRLRSADSDSDAQPAIDQRQVVGQDMGISRAHRSIRRRPGMHGVE